MAEKKTKAKLDRELQELQIEKLRSLNTQALVNIELMMRQTKTEFWKVGIASVIAGAALGGVFVSLITA